MTTAQLQTIVARVRRQEENWETTIAENVPDYDPTDPFQPTADKHMDDWDELDDERAHDARELLLALTAELEGIIAGLESGR
ncbi:hypothetical protein [Kitasatospora sp. MBT66]|uniref:hypothetical protein n=1 Tax=Kitasatospora sp. MBT66 TaxID=1444769 RepID=UPI0005BD4F8D|nr:hypothetical protein [Kitasatospora sp. MBT66]